LEYKKLRGMPQEGMEVQEGINNHLFVPIFWIETIFMGIVIKSFLSFICQVETLMGMVIEFIYVLD